MAAIAKKPTNPINPTIGMVRGKGTQTSDSIDAKLSNGESVLNAGATKALKAMLKKTGMTIDKFNDLHAPKDAETKIVDGELNAALGVDLGAQSRIDELTGVAKKTRPSAMQSAKAFDQMPTTRPVTAADVNFKSGIKPTTAPTIGTPTTALVNDTTIPQVASKTGNLAKIAGKAAVVAPLAINMYDASQDIANNPQMDTLSKVSRYANAAADQVAPLSEIAASGVNAVTGADIETESQKLARQQGTQTDYQKYVGGYKDLTPFQGAVKAGTDVATAINPVKNLVSKVGSYVMDSINNSSSPVAQQKPVIATKPDEPVAATQPQVGTQNTNPVGSVNSQQSVVKRGLAVGEFMPEVSKPEGNISPIGKAPDTEVYTTSPLVEGQPQARVSFKAGTPAIAKNTRGVDSVMTIDNGRGGTGTVSGSSAGMARLGKPEVQSRLAGEFARNADPAFQARMAEQVKIVDDRIAKRLANEAVIKKEAEQQQQAAQRNALIAQTKQSGNIGDKAVREAAMAQLQALDANARAEQDNQYKMATLGQNASQFDKQQQAAMAAVKNAATKDERDYQLKQQESDKPMDFYTPQFEKDGVTPIVDEVTGVQKQVRETMRPSEREARQKAANAQKLTSTLSDLKKVVDDPAASKEDKEAAALFIAKYGKGQ